MRPYISPFARCVIGAIALLVMDGHAWANSSTSALPPLRNAAPAPPYGTGSEPPAFSGMLAAHNHARGLVGVPPLQWSSRLAQIAQGWAEHLGGERCAMRHSGASGLGENLAWAAGQHLSPADVVKMWVGEAHAYDPAGGECAAGAVCGHYTQIVWRGTRYVGCGMVSCGNAEVWVCNYSPPGNYEGERAY